MDKYEAEIERLVGEDGEELNNSWADTTSLFQFCSDNPETYFAGCGCLTMIRCCDMFSARGPGQHPGLTAAIRDDLRIPASRYGDYVPKFREEWNSMSISDRRDLLNVFADWQRAMDATIRQGKPWHPEFAPPMPTAAMPVESAVPVIQE